MSQCLFEQMFSLNIQRQILAIEQILAVLQEWGMSGRLSVCPGRLSSVAFVTLDTGIGKSHT